MSGLGSALAGLSLLALSVAAMSAVGLRLRAALLPAALGVLGWQVAAALGLLAQLVAAELLGLTGQLHRWPLLVTDLALGVVAVASARGRLAFPALPRARRPSSRTVLALVGMVLVSASWLVGMRAASHTGITAVDALDYHLPFAVDFLRTGHTGAIDFVSAGDPSPYYPANDELLRAVAMALFGRDAVIPLTGLVLLPLVWGAAWSAGRAVGRGAELVLCASVLLAVLGRDYAASAMNDWTGIWALLLAAAVALTARRPGWREAALIGVLAGLAAGTKLSFLAPAAVLVLVAVARSERKARALPAAAVGAFLASGFWYVRNWVHAGTPVPGVRALDALHLGGPSMPHLARLDRSVASYLTDAGVIRHWFVPGLRHAMGPTWWVVCLLAAVGIGWALLKPSRPEGRLVAGVAAAWLLLYLVTPASAGGDVGRPVLFTFNVRFAYAGLLLGLAALLVARLPGWAERLLPGVLVTVVAVTVVAGGAIGSLVVLALAVVGLAAALAVLAHRNWVLGAAAIAALVAVGAVGYDHAFVRHRYAGGSTARLQLLHAAQSLHDVKVAVAGYPLKYAFFGAHLENDVHYVGEHGKGGSFEDFTTCAAWNDALVSGEYDVVVVQPFKGQPAPPMLAWTAERPGTTTVFANSAGSIFRIAAGSASGCDG